MNKPALLNASGQPADLYDLAQRIFHIANVLDVMARALPEDRPGEPAVCSLLEVLAPMAEGIAIEVSELKLIEGARDE